MTVESEVQTVISHKTLAIILAFVLVVVLIVGGLAIYDAVGEHVARLAAEAQAAADQKIADAARASNTTLETANQQLAAAKQKSDELASQALAQISQQRSAATTPEQMASLIHSFSGQTPVITQQPATATSPSIPLATLPLPALTDYEAACQKCSVSLKAANSDVASLTTSNQNLQKEMQNAQTEIAEAQKEAASYKTALKGGTFWQKFKHDSKVVVISVAAGAAIGYVAHR